MSNVPELGKVIDGNQYRDAIHIAVAPVLATERLAPGEHIGFVGVDKESVGRSKSPIGIVDPFLTGPVFVGERFWMFLYQNSITTLRHEWTHPAFEPSPSASKSASVKYIENLASDVGLSYQALLDAAKDWIRYEEYETGGSRMEGMVTPPEFWDHYEAVTGEKVEADKRQSFFSCSC